MFWLWIATQMSLAGRGQLGKAPVCIVVLCLSADLECRRRLYHICMGKGARVMQMQSKEIPAARSSWHRATVRLFLIAMPSVC